MSSTQPFSPVGNFFTYFLPEEIESVSSACDKRKTDFLSGRYCARRVLTKLGIRPEFIPVAPSRAPLWPEGFVGSITHTEGYCAAVAGRTRDFLSMGIDGQRIKPGRINEGMKRMILRDDEEYSSDFHLNLIFSAKEALFKCLNPLVNKFFGFHCARVERICETEKRLFITVCDEGIMRKTQDLFGDLKFEVWYEASSDLVVTIILGESH